MAQYRTNPMHERNVRIGLGEAPGKFATIEGVDAVVTIAMPMTLAVENNPEWWPIKNGAPIPLRVKGEKTLPVGTRVSVILESRHVWKGCLWVNFTNVSKL